MTYFTILKTAVQPNGQPAEHKVAVLTPNHGCNFHLDCSTCGYESHIASTSREFANSEARLHEARPEPEIMSEAYRSHAEVAEKMLVLLVDWRQDVTFASEEAFFLLSEEGDGPFRARWKLEIVTEEASEADEIDVFIAGLLPLRSGECDCNGTENFQHERGCSSQKVQR